MNRSSNEPVVRLIGSFKQLSRNSPSIVGLDDRLHEHILSDQPAVFFHNEVKLFDKGGVVTQHMDHVMLAASRPVDVPERLSDQVLGFSVVFLLLQTDGIVILFIVFPPEYC